MAATITFTATHNGEEFTRTSGTMPYVAVSVGSQVMWHKTMASAYAAAKGKYQTHATGVPATVIPAVPTAINGKLGDWTPEVDGWGDIPASAFTELVAAKRGGGIVKSNLDRRVESAPVPSQADIEDTIQAELDEQAAKRAKAAADRRRQRAAKKAREAGEPEPTTAPSPYPGEVEMDRLRAAKEARQRAPRQAAPAKAEKVAKVAAPATVEGMVLARVPGKPQARLDTVSNTLVWRNSSKGRAAREAGLWV